MTLRWLYIKPTEEIDGAVYLITRLPPPLILCQYKSLTSDIADQNCQMSDHRLSYQDKMG